MVAMAAVAAVHPCSTGLTVALEAIKAVAEAVTEIQTLPQVLTMAQAVAVACASTTPATSIEAVPQAIRVL